MKRVFERAGDPGRARVASPATPDEVRAFIDEVGYPVIAKPDVGVGAARTYRLDDDDDLRMPSSPTSRRSTTSSRRS